MRALVLFTPLICSEHVIGFILPDGVATVEGARALVYPSQKLEPQSAFPKRFVVFRLCVCKVHVQIRPLVRGHLFNQKPCVQGEGIRDFMEGTQFLRPPGVKPSSL